MSNPNPQEIIDEIVRNDCIVVATVHHTGTWFLLNFLLGLKEVPELVEMKDLYSGAKKLSKGCLLHFHLTGKLVDTKQHTPYHFSFEDDIIPLMRKVRSIVTVRDPLKSLITREQRLTGEDHTFIVRGFTTIPHCPAEYFPVDMHDNGNERLRLSMFYNLVARLSFDCDDNQHWIESYVDRWPVTEFNSRGDYGLKALYEKHCDLIEVRKAIPYAYNYLIQCKHEIIPFMEALGYRDLPWWKEVATSTQ